MNISQNQARSEHDSIISIMKYMQLHFIKFYYAVSSDKLNT